MGNEITINWTTGSTTDHAVLNEYCADGVLKKDEISKLTPSEKAVLEAQFLNINLDGKKDISLDSWLNKINREDIANPQAGINADTSVVTPLVKPSEDAIATEKILSTESGDSSGIVSSTESPDIDPQDKENPNRRTTEKIVDNLGVVQTAENTLSGAITGGVLGSLALVKSSSKQGFKLGLASGAAGAIIGGVLGAIVGGVITYFGTKKYLDNKRENRIDYLEQYMPPEPSNDASKVIDQQSEPATSPQLETTPLVTPSSSEVVPQANPVPEIVVANLTPPPESASADDAEDDKKAGQVDESEDSKSDKDVKSDETKDEKDSDKKDEELEEEK